jgi:hypothetical protein
VGTDAPPNWREVFQDSGAAHICGLELGWDLRGDDPTSFLDHTWSYRHPGQNSLYPSGADARNGGADIPNPTLSGRTRFSVFLSCQPMVLAKEA